MQTLRETQVLTLIHDVDSEKDKIDHIQLYPKTRDCDAAVGDAINFKIAEENPEWQKQLDLCKESKMKKN